MLPAPLQIESYFVTEVNFTANAGFDPREDAALHFEDFKVATHFHVLEDESWNVSLRLDYDPDTTTNVPCHFHLGMTGVFRVAKNYPAGEVERLVRINGPSILYSLSREVARNITAMGPTLSLGLPPVSFYQPMASAVDEQVLEVKSVEKAKNARVKLRVARKRH